MISLRRLAIAFAPMAALIALPLAMRTNRGEQASSGETLVIITPHNEATRSEFRRAFAAYRRNAGLPEVALDWRTPGGSSDIVRFIDDQFRATFLRERGDMPLDAAGSFNDPSFDASDKAEAPGAAARKKFLAGDFGIGIDLAFGGSQFDFNGMANKGYLVDNGVAQRHPDWFSDAIIPERLGGEVIRDRNGRYVASCLASFGICSNRDRLAALDAPTPTMWQDLGQPWFLGQVAMADPSKSGSIARCFEMMIQQTMALSEKAVGSDSDESRRQGWSNAFLLIKRIAGNARSVNDAASKVTRDVGRGDAAVGMCIDFYGRSESQWTATANGKETLVYVTPAGGTSISGDQIALFRGAPNVELARSFIDFVLSPEGQRLWNYRVGEPGGPIRYALRRWPVRKDCYGEDDRKHMSDPNENPFELATLFRFRPEWTGSSFGLIRTLIKTVALDCRDEVREAWSAIVAAGGPEAVPDAMREFAWLPVEFPDIATAQAALKAGGIEAQRLQRSWTVEAQRHYREARTLAVAKARP